MYFNFLYYLLLGESDLFIAKHLTLISFYYTCHLLALLAEPITHFDSVHRGFHWAICRIIKVPLINIMLICQWNEMSHEVECVQLMLTIIVIVWPKFESQHPTHYAILFVERMSDLSRADMDENIVSWD